MEARRTNNRYSTTVIPARSLHKKNNTMKISSLNIGKKTGIFDHQSHDAARLLYGSQPTRVEFKKFVTLLYRGLFYSVNNLKGPSDEFIKRKSITLPEPKSTLVVI